MSHLPKGQPEADCNERRESDEEEEGLDESDDNCSDSGSEVSYSDLDDDDCSETEIDGNF